MPDASALQYGALGLLFLVLAGLFALSKMFLVPMVRSVISTNEALVTSMARMGERLTSVDGRVDQVREELSGLRRDFGRAGIHRTTPEPPESAEVTPIRRPLPRPRTDPDRRR